MRRAAIALIALLGGACGGPADRVGGPPAREDIPPLGSLARLRMIVRVCGQNELALADNIDVGADRVAIEAAVTPGDVFYVWLQGWDECNPPCVEDSLQAMNDQSCVCINDGETPNYQVFPVRGLLCVGLRDGDALVPLTLSTVDRDSRLCPPAPRSSCDP